MFKNFYQKKFFFSTISVSQVALSCWYWLAQWVLYIRAAGAKTAYFAKLVNIICSLGMSYAAWFPTTSNMRISNEASAILHASSCGSILIAVGSWSHVVKFFSMAQELIIAGSLDLMGVSFGSSFFGSSFESIVFNESCIDIFLISSFIYYYVIKSFFFLMLPFFGAFCMGCSLFFSFYCLC